MRIATLLLTMLAFLTTTSLAASPPCGTLPGPEPAGSEPALFAPDWVNQGARTRDISLSADGRELYFCVMVGGFSYSTILVTRRADDGCWTEPEVLPFAADPRWHYLEPHLAPDGERLFYVCDRPLTGDQPADATDIWVARRDGDRWVDHQRLPAHVNTEGAETFPSVTRDGTLYFGRREPGSRQEVIMRARPDGEGGWLEAEVLPEQVNAAGTQFNAFVDPAERYLIVCLAGHPENLGQVDYWIAFRNADDTWRGPVNLGPRINGAGREGWSPYVSPDGRWFFFMSAATTDRTEPLTTDGLRAIHEAPGNGLGHVWFLDAACLDELAEAAHD